MRSAWKHAVPPSVRTALCSLPLCLLLAHGAATAQTQTLCVYGVSKSLCTGKLSGAWTTAPACGINPAGTACKTATMNQGALSGTLESDHPTCDEVPELDGDNLFGTLQGVLRLQTPDPYRGSLNGAFSIQNGPQQVAAGTLWGTIGVGTHNPAKIGCACAAGKTCEGCYVVAAPSSPSVGPWSLHSEGFLDGRFSVSGRVVQPGCTLHWSYAGTFTAPGTTDGPSLSHSWDFCGTIDGVIECPCTLNEKPKHRGS